MNKWEQKKIKTIHIKYALKQLLTHFIARYLKSIPDIYSLDQQFP